MPWELIVRVRAVLVTVFTRRTNPVWSGLPVDISYVYVSCGVPDGAVVGTETVLGIAYISSYPAFLREKLLPRKSVIAALFTCTLQGCPSVEVIESAWALRDIWENAEVVNERSLVLLNVCEILIDSTPMILSAAIHKSTSRRVNQASREVFFILSETTDKIINREDNRQSKSNNSSPYNDEHDGF